jgi:hypothetical protein
VSLDCRAHPRQKPDPYRSTASPLDGVSHRLTAWPPLYRLTAWPPLYRLTAWPPPYRLTAWPPPYRLTAWPPNWLRRAATALMAGESSWREVKRAKSEAAITFIGTPRRMASSTVQRPSPVSSA